jgi:hypothetical protein
MTSSAQRKPGSFAFERASAIAPAASSPDVAR